MAWPEGPQAIAWLVPGRTGHGVCRISPTLMDLIAWVGCMAANVQPVTDVPKPTAGRRRHVPQVRQAGRSTAPEDRRASRAKRGAAVTGPLDDASPCHNADGAIINVFHGSTFGELYGCRAMFDVSSPTDEKLPRRAASPRRYQSE